MKLNLDYAQLDALLAVVREGSFEAAARALHLTPSALSQRIKQLEQRVGGVLIERGRPCRISPLGEPLLRHAQQVALLEQGLWAVAANKTTAVEPVSLAVAVNADSLSTWFLPAVTGLAAGGQLLLDLRVDDEEHTQEALRRGEVLAAVTARATPVQGCRSHLLGVLRYRACASPAFAKRWLAAGVQPAQLVKAPCLRFNAKDGLQQRWLERQARRALPTPPAHRLPSSTAFVQACEAGLGWGLHPEPLVLAALADGRLIDLSPRAPFDVPLYWQCTRLALPMLERLSQAVLACAVGSLRRGHAGRGPPG